ncbi:LysE family translocator, partial [Klebsiella pneumoniae]|uniref:LysE family translocator n=1 Tax=Klebsiella pneumoniae TaxID=573 RepID=UPI00214CD69D
MEHISGDSFIQKEARPLFDVNTLQHLPDGFAVMTGLGVALGDAFYSGLGLFGLATLITQCEEIFSLIRIVGGA